MDIILEVLEGSAGKEQSDWILWAEQNALVLNPAFTFPFSKYTEAGHSIVMYGNPDDALAGSVNGTQGWTVSCRSLTQYTPAAIIQPVTLDHGP